MEKRVQEHLIHSGSRRLSRWESASFDFASLRSGRTGAIVRSFLHWFSRLLLLALSAGPAPAAERASTEAEAAFVRGYRHYAAGERSSAEPLFRRALSDADFVLGDYALYYLGRIASDAERHDQARDYWTRLKDSHPRSLWAAESPFEIIELDLAQERYGAAIRRAEAQRRTASGKTARAKAAYYLGRAHEAIGESPQAYAFHQEARGRAPRSAWSRRARERVRELRRKHPRRLGLRGADPMLREARLLRRERDYSAAADLYRRILRETNFRRLSLEGLAAVYRKLRQRDREEQVLGELVRRYPGNAEAGTALVRIATIQWNRDDDAKALETLRRYGKEYPHHPYGNYAVYVTARIHESMGRWQEAVRGYRRASTKDRRFSRFHDDAAWRLAWIHYLRSDYPAAGAVFRGIARRPGNFRTAASFWAARTAERLEDRAAAERTYRRLVEDRPESYYAGLALRRLAVLGAALPDAPPAGSRAGEGTGDPPLGDRAKFHLARARTLTRLGLDRLAHPELDRVRRHARGTPGLKRLLMREYAHANAHHQSLSLALRSPAVPETSRLRFPLAYWELVRRRAAENGVDPYLVLSLMRKESRFEPGAVSPANALGLMQLLHETARSEASKMGLPEPRERQLFDPRLNIRLGVHHLKGLLETYSHSRAKALAAYNAGKEAVDRWSRNLGSGDDVVFVERIPYRETRQYVKAVLRNHRLYRTLYRPAPPREHPGGCPGCDEPDP